MSGSCQLQRKILHHQSFENTDQEERERTNLPPLYKTEAEDQADKESKLELKQMSTKAKKMDETIEHMFEICRKLKLEEEKQ